MARVVLVEESESVLLLSGRDASAPERGGFWFTPGGGVEPGESLEEAARREVLEETGHELGELGPEMWHRRTAFWFDGQHYDQEETWFVVACERFEPVAVAWTEVEARTMTGARWWPVEELALTEELLYPAELPELVSRWLAPLRARAARSSRPA